MLSWVLSLLWILVPRSSYRDTYADTAAAIAEASQADPLFEGPHGVERTAALLVALANEESHFDPHAVGDHGRSRGLYQVGRGHFPGVDLFDPRAASYAAIMMMRWSLRACHALPFPERLAWYTSGSCDRGRAASRRRMNAAAKLLRDHPFGGGDS